MTTLFLVCSNHALGNSPKIGTSPGINGTRSAVTNANTVPGYQRQMNDTFIGFEFSILTSEETSEVSEYCGFCLGRKVHDQLLLDCYTDDVGIGQCFDIV